MCKKNHPDVFTWLVIMLSKIHKLESQPFGLWLSHLSRLCLSNSVLPYFTQHKTPYVISKGRSVNRKQFLSCGYLSNSKRGAVGSLFESFHKKLSCFLWKGRYKWNIKPYAPRTKALSLVITRAVTKVRY